MSPDQPQFENYWRKRIELEGKINNKEISFWDWVKFGEDMKWTSDVFCETHDGPKMTDEEEKEWYSDDAEVCMNTIRVW